MEKEISANMILTKANGRTENMYLKEPNIVPFKTNNGNQYIYDACTNRIFPSPGAELDIALDYKKESKSKILEKLKKRYDEDELDDAYSIVQKWVNKDKAFFHYPDKPEKWDIDEKYFWDIFHLKSSQRIVLEVTQDCNFRCNYCGFGGQYQFSRTHTRKTMNFEIAKDSIDFLLNVIDENNRSFLLGDKGIGFYGGEPLLNFELIKKCVQYVKEIRPDEEFRYSFTTNGSLLKGEILDFVVENDFKILVSLDGPEEIHNRNRVFKNNRKSFKAIYNNLNNIQTKYPEFFRRNIDAIGCYDYRTNVTSVRDFFDQKHKDNSIPDLSRLAMVEGRDTDYYGQFTKAEVENFQEMMNLLKKEYKDNCNCGRKDKFLDMIFNITLNRIVDRKFPLSEVSNANKNMIKYTGTCMPGLKLFVSVDGQFHMCEKINYHFPIGDHKVGLNFPQIKRIMDKYFESIIDKKDCHICVCRHMCSICFSNVGKDGYFDGETGCMEAKISFKKSLSDYFSIYEENPNVMELYRNNRKIIDA